MQKKHVLVIGGGAAGFFASANVDPSLFSLTLLEQNQDVLQKVKVSGGGRCNVSHAEFDPRELVAFYPRGYRELKSVFSKFQPGDTMAWFSERGVELKIEADGRIFPESNSSQTIIDCLKNEVLKKGFQIETKTTVQAIVKSENGFNVQTTKADYKADYVIFATGSSPKSLKLLESLGHSIIPQVPSLFTFNIKDPRLEGLAGTSFATSELQLPELKSSEHGPLLITHWGLSGPCILKASAWNARGLAERQYKFRIKVNFVGISSEELKSRLLQHKQDHPKKSLIQSKIFELTNRFWASMLSYCRIPPDQQMASLSSEQLNTLVKNLCESEFDVDGKSTFKEEFVSAGGINLKEINFKTMSSRHIEGLYIAGEVLDIDAVTGGFNFQACWSEGWLVSEALNGLASS